MYKKTIYSLFSLFITLLINAQKMEVLSGDFNFLKNVKEINVVFDYSDVTFYRKKMPESQYIQLRSDQVEAKETTENWQQTWNEYKEIKFPDKFFASANKYIEPNTITFTKNSQSPYTLIIKTIWIRPGSAILQALVSTTLHFVETNNPSKELLVISSKEAPGKSYAIHRNIIISEGYAMTGKKLANLLNKKIKP
ncbi:hypothetical protein [Apibacter sp. HY039]|uniref:hypothetical protein n=1 Tax=Apibacter sp. HY039 TaxID=2501476 RepID=UPI000FEBBB29|nr:hypothetical protein [Apibacter sp. HY039]